METAFCSDECFTQAEFRVWLEKRPSSDRNHYELLNGRIVMTPPAGWPHSSIASNVLYLLRRHVDERGLGRVLESSAGYDLPSGDTVEPDVSFFSHARFAAGPQPADGDFLGIVPDLVVEILLPSTARRDRTEKKGIYERNGVAEYWLVDPRRQQVVVFLRASGRGFEDGRVFTGGRVDSHLFPDLEITVEEILAR